MAGGKARPRRSHAKALRCVSSFTDCAPGVEGGCVSHGRVFFQWVFLEKVAGNLTGTCLLGNISDYFWFQFISVLGVAPDQQPPELHPFR